MCAVHDALLGVVGKSPPGASNVGWGRSTCAQSAKYASEGRDRVGSQCRLRLASMSCASLSQSAASLSQASLVQGVMAFSASRRHSSACWRNFSSVSSSVIGRYVLSSANYEDLKGLLPTCSFERPRQRALAFQTDSCLLLADKKSPAEAGALEIIFSGSDRPIPAWAPLSGNIGTSIFFGRSSDRDGREP